MSISFKITMSVEDLLATLETNLKKHEAAHKEAYEGWFRQARQELAEQLNRMDHGKQPKKYMQFNPPASHADDYKRMINMLKSCQNETLELDENDFRKLVDDQWSWVEEFATAYRSHTGRDLNE